MRRFLYSILQSCFSNILFYQKSNVYYLTIDDSPSEETDTILKILDEYEVKASFFCVGKNVEMYPKNFQLIIDRGHTVGYHSYDHRSNWRMTYREIVDDFKKSEKLFHSQMYRPPYGKLSLWFFFYLRRRNIRTILWTILMEDWKNLENPTKTLDQKLKNAPLGSIFVFHDNEKSKKNIKIMLPLFLQSAVNKNIEILALK